MNISQKQVTYMLPKIWLYNYDFEFKLANSPAVTLKKTHPKKIASFAPWYLLNRSANIFIPLIDQRDLIFNYQKPSDEIKKILTQTRVNLPEFILPDFNQVENNSCLDGLKSKLELEPKLKKFQIQPWGVNSSILNFSDSSIQKKLISQENIKKINSKAFSTELRNKLLPNDYQIESLIISQKLKPDKLKETISNFQKEHGTCLIKHELGSSGKYQFKLSKDEEISKTLLRKILGWLTEKNQVILEKELKIKNEWSIHFQIKGKNKIEAVGVTKLYSKNRSYLGTVLNNSYFEAFAAKIKQLEALADNISNYGYRGAIGFDLIETEESQFKLIEINCRWTMGRIALEWHKKYNSHPTGIFWNQIQKRNSAIISGELKYKCNQYSKSCLIIPINQIQEPQSKLSLNTWFIGANQEKQGWQVLKQLNKN